MKNNNLFEPSFAKKGWSDYNYWVKTNPKTLRRVNKLIKSIYRDGFLKGIGKPELLRYEYGKPTYSRRIDHKNRLVYVNYHGIAVIISCKGHYEQYITIQNILNLFVPELVFIF